MDILINKLLIGEKAIYMENKWKDENMKMNSLEGQLAQKKMQNQDLFLNPSHYFSIFPSLLLFISVSNCKKF